MNRNFQPALPAWKKVRVAARRSFVSLQPVLKCVAIFTLLAAISFVPVRQTSAACALVEKSASGSAAQCQSCCEEKPCCAAQDSPESHPLLPLASGSSFQPGAAVAPMIPHFLYALPLVEKTVVYTSESARSHPLPPLALSCIQLI